MQAPADTRFDRSRELLERSAHLSLLAESLAAVITGSHGRLVFVVARLGWGRPCCCGTFAGRRPVRRESCGARVTRFSLRGPSGPSRPRPDHGRRASRARCERGQASRGRAGARRELNQVAPTIVVLDDVHWADEATLDVLRLLGRRLETPPSSSPVTGTTSSIAPTRSGSCSGSSLRQRRSAASSWVRFRRRPWRCWPSPTASTRWSYTADCG